MQDGCHSTCHAAGLHPCKRQGTLLLHVQCGSALGWLWTICGLGCTWEGGSLVDHKPRLSSLRFNRLQTEVKVKPMRHSQQLACPSSHNHGPPSHQMRELNKVWDVKNGGNARNRSSARYALLRAANKSWGSLAQPRPKAEPLGWVAPTGNRMSMGLRI